jgi:hypothetical protein
VFFIIYIENKKYYFNIFLIKKHPISHYQKHALNLDSQLLILVDIIHLC